MSTSTPTPFPTIDNTNFLSGINVGPCGRPDENGYFWYAWGNNAGTADGETNWVGAGGPQPDRDLGWVTTCKSSGSNAYKCKAGAADGHRYKRNSSQKSPHKGKNFRGSESSNPQLPQGLGNGFVAGAIPEPSSASAFKSNPCSSGKIHTFCGRDWDEAMTFRAESAGDDLPDQEMRCCLGQESDPFQWCQPDLSGPACAFPFNTLPDACQTMLTDVCTTSEWTESDWAADGPCGRLMNANNPGMASAVRDFQAATAAAAVENYFGAEHQLDDINPENATYLNKLLTYCQLHPGSCDNKLALECDFFDEQKIADAVANVNSSSDLTNPSILPSLNLALACAAEQIGVTTAPPFQPETLPPTTTPPLIFGATSPPTVPPLLPATGAQPGPPDTETQAPDGVVTAAPPQVTAAPPQVTAAPSKSPVKTIAIIGGVLLAVIILVVGVVLYRKSASKKMPATSSRGSAARLGT